MTSPLRIAAAMGAALTITGCGVPPRIEVLQATFGRTCGADPGNVTWAVDDVCSGRAGCELPLTIHRLGYFAEGCGKDFEVRWACTGRAGIRRAYEGADTSTGAVVRLWCD